MKITPLQQYILAGVLLLGMASGLYYQFLLKPINATISNLIATRDEKKKELDEAKKVHEKYVEFKKRADSIQRELEWIQNRIPKSIDKAKLLEAISFVQSKSGVFLTSLQFGVPTDGPGGTYTAVPANIRFSASYEGLRNFLQQVSLSGLFMVAHNLTIDPVASSDHPSVSPFCSNDIRRDTSEMMKPGVLKKRFFLLAFCLAATFSLVWAQQQDVPEPVFMNFSIQPLYVPTYHGRDPFKPLDNVDRLPQVSISELDFHGVILAGKKPVALFTWRGNPSVRYTLKFRKLYGGGENAVDGVVGDISDSEVVLVQGDQKIVYPRK